MSTSEPAPRDARIRPELPDDPTIWEDDDALWARIAPLVASTHPRKKPGRPRRDDRVLVNGLSGLARTGAQWAALPARYAPKSTLHARFRGRVAGGVFARPWAYDPEAYDPEAYDPEAYDPEAYDDRIGVDRHRQAADGCVVKAPRGATGRERRGASDGARAHPHRPRQLRHEAPPADRWARGAPSACIISEAGRIALKRPGASRDARPLEAPLVHGPGGQPAPRERCLDRGYGSDACREAALAHGYRPHGYRPHGYRPHGYRPHGYRPPIPPDAGAEPPPPPPGDPARHPARRRVVEVGHARFIRLRRLLIRWGKQAASYLAFIRLAACLIIYRTIRHATSLSGCTAKCVVP